MAGVSVVEIGGLSELLPAPAVFSGLFDFYA